MITYLGIRPFKRGHMRLRAPMGPRSVNWPIANSMYIRGNATITRVMKYGIRNAPPPLLAHK